jgi:hypothetical protein
MHHSVSPALRAAPAVASQPRWFLAPAAAMLYPLTLMAFHEASSAITQGAGPLAWLTAALMLLLAFAVPVLALLQAIHLGRIAAPSRAELLARRVAFFAVATPPLFTLTGVIFLLIGKPTWDAGFLALLWAALILLIAMADRTPVTQVHAANPSHANWRTSHGIAAVLAVLFLCFHFSNHLLGLIGVDTHMAVMKVLRVVYRSPVIEPLLLASFAFLIVTGARMAWRLTGRQTDAIRTFQIAGGVFLIFSTISHVNAVLYLARVHFGIDTDWGFAIGAPTGMLKDAWNIRLLPYYLLAVFFVIAHAFCGLRGVMLAHRMGSQLANRVLAAGTVLAALVACAIILAMCGLRVQFV